MICHVNLARGFRGGERQTELLIREFSNLDIDQRLIARRGEPLAMRVEDLPGLDLQESSGTPLSVVRRASGATAVVVHEGRSVHFASLRQRLFGTPYLVVRRVDNPIKNNALTRSAYRNAACIVVLSRAIKKEILKLDPNLACEIVPSATSALSHSESGASAIRQQYPGKILVGHVGALDHSHKGQLDIIEIANRLQTTHPQIQFILLGKGRDESLFREKTATLSNVDLVGFVNNVGDFLAAFDFFLFPSLHEGLGSILLDAMERALPIVATQVGGIPDLIVDGDNGLLVPPGDSGALHDALLKFVDDPDAASQMGRRGQQRACDYSPARMAGRYLELIRRIAR